MKKRGEVTIFLCAAFVLISALLFTTLEAVQTCAGTMYAQVAAKASVESGFAEFYRPLWEEYRILAFYEKEPFKKRMEHYLDCYAGDGGSFLRFRTDEVQVVQATYLTEQGGRFIQESGADYMKYHVAADLLQNLVEPIDLVGQIRRAAGFIKELAGFSEQILEVEAQLRKIQRLAESVTEGIREGVREAKRLEEHLAMLREQMQAGLSEEDAVILLGNLAWETGGRLEEPLRQVKAAWPKLTQEIETFQKQASVMREKLEGAWEAFQMGDYTGMIRSLLEEQLEQVQTYSSQGGARYGDVLGMESDLFAGISQLEAFETLVADLTQKETFVEKLSALESWIRMLTVSGWQLPAWLEELGDLKEVAKDVVDFDVKIWTEESLLRLVVGEDAVISDAEFTADGLLSKEPDIGESESFDLTASLLFRAYLAEELSHFQEPKNSHALTYEVEYLLGGHLSDRENLLAVVGDLLLLRESVNVIGYLSDPLKKQEAAAVAVAMAGASGSPILVSVLQTGVLAAWAFEDAIVDVKALLQGEKVPLLRLSGEAWIPLGYEGYLNILLGFLPVDTLRLASMDLIQATMKQKDKTFDLRKCLYQAEIVIDADVLGGNYQTRQIADYDS